MAKNSSYFGAPQKDQSEIENFELSQLPDGRTRTTRKITAEIITPNGGLVQRERLEILCEHEGDEWIIPGVTGKMLDGKFVCYCCAGKIKRGRFWRRFFRIKNNED